MNDNQEERSDLFRQLGLSESLLRSVADVGYEVPTPIQAKVIPHLLAGRDVIGQAQTGTGKTAAFALPILEQLDPERREVQALILTPTRELAIQVSEAIYTYSRHLSGVRVAPIYGGQSMRKQINRLRSGLHVVVGTPGRVMDHLRRGTLTLDATSTFVLDEADEMLRMGFLEDVEWILEQMPVQEGSRIQIALFSATMPKAIRQVADRYLHDPVVVQTEHKALTVPAVEQRYLNVAGQQKLDALTRILETEETDGVLIFVRTRVGAAELAEKLDARGYGANAMHGDMNQSQRETVIRQLRDGRIDIVAATDVAARGLDVERISHVVNYDIPYDTESYVHRIGRTARAGRSGTAILFVTPRQQRMRRDIERYTGQTMSPMPIPTQADVAARRATLFKESVLEILDEKEAELGLYLQLVEEIALESECDMSEIAAATALLAHEGQPLVVPLEPEGQQLPQTEEGMIRFFVDAGRQEGVRPGDIVGAIANEADIPGKAIGAIDIYDHFTYVEVPAQYQEQVLAGMTGTTIRHRQANIRPATTADQVPDTSRKGRKRKGKKERQRKGK
ncbi:MAG: DEAD/DEAH box helicase [Candidatus Promineifilaceae bacterium]|nr:DEAD/DEAH box helicase [Candidatus Promineifilaceae bacterium]